MDLEDLLEFAILAHRASDDWGNSDETLPSFSFQAFCPVLRFGTTRDSLRVLTMMFRRP